MKARALLFLLVLPLALRAGDDLPPPTGRIVDYSEIQEIFDKRCVECHEGETAPNALNLIDTRSYNLLINEAAQSFPSLKRVKPGSAAQSFLFQKVNSDTPKAGQRMPIGTKLPVEEQVAIRDWINQGALPVNRNPVIDSGPSLSSPTPRAGEGVRFLIAVSDPNADPLTFAWDFGDGGTSTLPDPVHTYAAAGNYTATLTVKDGRNGERVVTLNVSVVADSDTDADGVPNLTDPDDDGDGFSDGLEALAQSDPLNAASTPLGGSAVVPGALTLAQFRAKFDFKKSSNDSFSARVQFELPPGFSVSGQSALLDVGGILRSASFDARGASSSATDSVKLKLKKLKTGSNLGGDLSIKSKSATLADAFLGLQQASESDAEVAALPRTFAVFLGGQSFSGAATLSYKRKKGGPGAAALAK